MDDQELLGRYAWEQSEAAFAELVSRHVNLVYSTALRRVEEPDLARDVVQIVFIELARKPKSVGDPRALAGWLYRAARNAASNVLRSERRRRQRESDAMQLNSTDTDTQSVWHRLAPHLEEAIDSLGTVDQNVIVLRFFEGKSLRETGLALSMTEDAVQKRATRALEKLRMHFSRRGLATSTALIATALASHSVQAAPAGLAVGLAGTSLAGASSASAKGITAILEILLMTKTKIAIVTALVLAAAITPVAWHHYRGTDARRQGFDATYRLRDGEVLRHAAAPFISERTDYFQHLTSPDGTKARPLTSSARGTPGAMRPAPDHFIFHQDDSRPASAGSRLPDTQGRVGDTGFAGVAWGSDGFKLRDVLRKVIGLDAGGFEGPEELLSLPVPGDWTIRTGASHESLLAALEPVLRKATGRQFRFEKRTVERDVVVVRGSYEMPKAKPAAIRIFAEDSGKRETDAGVGNMQRFLNAIGDGLNLRFINETTSNPAGQFFWARWPDSQNPDADAAEKVLRNLTAQTSLSFGRERRAVDVWFVTEQP